MTPNDLEILIHCNCFAEVHPRSHTPAVKGSITQFVFDGILERRPEYLCLDIYKLTEKGRAWFEMILETPYPTLVWVDSRGKRR